MNRPTSVKTRLPTLVQGNFQTALHHHQNGRLPEAERLYKQILALDGRHADSIHLLGMIAFQTGNHILAADTIGKAIALNPNEALYQSNLGTVLQAQGKFGEALTSYQRAIALKPDYSDAHNNLANALVALGRIPDAIIYYERAIALNPAHADAHINLGVAFAEQGKIAEAIPYYERAIALKPECAEAFSNLGNALLALQRPDEAVSHFARALQLKPDYITCHYNLGNTLQAMNLPGDAIACYDRLLTFQPNHAQAIYGKALAQLVQGTLHAGWTNFEQRWDTPAQTPMRVYPQPLWTGESLTSGRLLLWGEQGVGDEIMFSGLVPDVTRSGNRCLLDCDARLRPLFARSFRDIEIVSDHSDLEISAHFPTGSLPRLFRNSVKDFALTTSPYLVADPTQTKRFRQSYANGKRVVGLAWFTRNPKTGPIRSVDLSLLAPLFERTDIAWISLQYGSHDDLERQTVAISAPVMVDRTVDQFTNMDLFAAQIAAMDLVITIDNSTAHLAGALGVPVWVLLPFAADWRWMQGREDSPWYPSMRLFRQRRHGDWASVIQNVAQNL